MSNIKLLDCTLRDGGYYNAWDFDLSLIEDYLRSMDAISIDYVEIGFRSLIADGFKGACAFSTDHFIRSIHVPKGMKIGVMVNAKELLAHTDNMENILECMFTHANQSPVSLIRVACHFNEFKKALPAVHWLKKHGYEVGFNLMQIADRSPEEIKIIAAEASHYPLDVLYFADSMGSLNPEKTANVIRALREGWKGPLGIHTHDNMNFALANTMTAIEEGVTWVDGTVTGMGRGPGNAKTEYLVNEIEPYRKKTPNNLPLLTLIKEHFTPLLKKYGWGTNLYYYLSGQYSIHPTYIQEMISDSRYEEEDFLTVIDYLRSQGGRKFNIHTLEAARHFYNKKPKGKWKPVDSLLQKEILIIGSGPTSTRHKKAIEEYIQKKKPYTIVLNTRTNIASHLVDARAVCHPIRVLSETKEDKFSQPLIMPLSMLENQVSLSFQSDYFYDFGLCVNENCFAFYDTYAVLPNSLALSYALAVAASGKAKQISLVGFDGYGAGDPRTDEVNKTLKKFLEAEGAPTVRALTPTEYSIPQTSIYAY
ncbi:aldolase catalytic domain-containing protein [Halobacillus faecis]